MAGTLVRVLPLQYLHILDSNTNVVSLECGPQNIPLQTHQTVVQQPQAMIMIPPLHYCTILNPVEVGSDGQAVKQQFPDEDGTIKEIYKVKFGVKQIRTHDTHPQPFPLYPYEQLVGSVNKLVQVAVQEAIKLKAVADFKDAQGNLIQAGQEWLIQGPCIYTPQVDVEIVQNIKAQIIQHNTALKIKAIRDCVDVNGNKRRAGEKWLIRTEGAYIPQVDEKVLKLRKAIIINQKEGLHLKARITFKDVYGKERKAGDEWVITRNISEFHIQDVNEKIIDHPQAITLTNRQYCYILDPYDEKTNTNRYGQKELRKGECTFFLQPKESIENEEILFTFVLSPDESLLLQADKPYKEGEKSYKSGEKWMVRGPGEYTPPVEVKVIETRKLIQLAEKEGIYIRDTKTGEVKSIIGQSYMLDTHEELWEKPLYMEIEWLLGFRIKQTNLLEGLKNISGVDASAVEKQIREQVEQAPVKQQQRMQRQQQMPSGPRVPPGPPGAKAALPRLAQKSSDKVQDAAKQQRKKKMKQMKNVRQQKVKAPIRNITAESQKKAQDEMDQYASLSDSDDDGDIRLNLEEDVMEKLQVLNVAQQQMNVQSQEAQFQNLLQEEKLDTMDDEQKSESEVSMSLQFPPQAPGAPQFAGMQVASFNMPPPSAPTRGRGRGRGASDVKKRSAFKGFQDTNIPEQLPFQQQYKPAPEEQQKITFKHGTRPWDDTISLRDKNKVIQFRAPHNSAVQIYDFKTKETRIEFGPELIMIEPDEILVLNRLSGGLPKRENAISLLYIPLGPDFMMDLVEIETSDHARLNLSLKYNWRFDVQNKEQAQNIFKIRDFVGYACRAMASRIRGFTSKYRFEEFHKNSAELIKMAVFGTSGQETQQELKFESNSLIIFGIDVQSVEPVDKKTRQGLSQSVAMAIEITTQMTKADAEHVAAKQEQLWTGLLSRQKIQDQVEAEKSKKRLLELQAESKAVESTGLAVAVAKAQSETQKIDGKAAVEKAKLKAKSETILKETDLDLDKLTKEQEVDHKKRLNTQEVTKARQLMEIEISKFEKQIKAVGSETLVAMAKAGPEQQAKLLQGLGLKGFMMMDGKRPVNLFNTAMGMVQGVTH